MSDAANSTLWIDLIRCDDQRDAVHQAVACLAQGGVIGLATETTYSLTASALRVDSLARLRGLAAPDGSSRLLLLIRGSEEAPDWVPGIPQVARRLARRLWPGPLSLVFPQEMTDGLYSRLPGSTHPLLSPDRCLELGSPAEPFLRDVLELSPGPLALAELEQEAAPTVTAEPLRELAGVDLVIDSGPVRTPGVLTRVRIDVEGWTVEREGVVDARTLSRMSGRILLFVCTGNTCRSPMAEAICKLLLARKLGCAIDELEARGYLVLSAGVAAMSGAPAAAHALSVVSAMGGTLEGHRSRRVTFELLRIADQVFAMTADHLETLLDAIPEARANACLLDPEGRDVPDPIGSDQETYRQTALRIEKMLEQRLAQLGL